MENKQLIQKIIIDKINRKENASDEISFQEFCKWFDKLDYLDWLSKDSLEYMIFARVAHMSYKKGLKDV